MVHGPARRALPSRSLETSSRPSTICEGVIARLLAVLITLTACEPLPIDVVPPGGVPFQERELVDLLREGAALYRAGKLVDAELRLLEAQTMAPGATAILETLALVKEGQGAYGDSVELYRALLARAPESSKYRMGLARAIVGAGDSKSSIEYYEQVLGKAIEKGDGKKGSDAARSLSSLYLLLGEEERARCYSQSAFALQPTSDELARHLRFLLSIGALQEGISLIVASHAGNYRGALQDQPELLLLRGLFYAGVSDFETARVLLATASLTADDQTDTDLEAKVARLLVDTLYREALAAPESRDGHGKEEDRPIRADEPAIPILPVGVLLTWPKNLAAGYSALLQRRQSHS